MKWFKILVVFLSFLSLYSVRDKEQKNIVLLVASNASERVLFGIERLKQALDGAGYKTKISRENKIPKKDAIIIGKGDDPLLQFFFTGNLSINKPTKKEGFSIASLQRNYVIAGTDENGVLYGCLELAEIIKKEGKLPQQIAKEDAPQMVLRGTCIGLQKTTYLPGRTVYEYPYTPENFPWFYDKQHWIRYLDSMVANRYNSLYLWNGHPFASLVRLKEYPYAVEVDDANFKKNEEVFRFLTTEANKRGIWIIQMFYNIILPKPFAEKHGLKTQDRSRPILPVIADYTRKSIAAFVEKYPNVGLLVTLGEAMEGEDTDVEWFTKTIIPGVLDGLKALGKKEEPPIVLRGHDTNPQKVMQAALPLYKNVYTMNKYNGEALTTYEPRGPWAQMHREMSELGSVHIANVHILANLEPFRYGSANFIQKSIGAMHKVHGANGLHLYPQASYWDWPYTADKANERILQIDRDWIWYKAWARYAWNHQRDRKDEIAYWSGLLGNRFGTTPEAGSFILKAYEESGEIAPKLLRRFGITNGNRQTLTLGMLMAQLVNPHKYRIWPELYSSDGPDGEMLMEYVEKEMKGESHKGETPMRTIDEVVAHGQKAVAAIEQAAGTIEENKEEFNRIKNDMHCYRALAQYFAEKVQAARYVLHYKYSNNISDLNKAIPHLEKAVQCYQQLAGLTKDTYLYANSMQTGQRKIPVGGNGGKNKTWVELLPYYQSELKNFRQNLDSLKHANTVLVRERKPWQTVTVQLSKQTQGFYRLEKGRSPFSDNLVVIEDLIPEINGLKAIQFSTEEQATRGTTVSFTTKMPVQLLVGYFDTSDHQFLSAPKLETDASANDRGQADVKVAHALLLKGMPPVNIHAYTFEEGKHSLVLSKGICLVLGFVDANQDIKTKGLKQSKELDWLFE